jgi:hypothetical protein
LYLYILTIASVTPLQYVTVHVMAFWHTIPCALIVGASIPPPSSEYMICEQREGTVVLVIEYYALKTHGLLEV